MNPTSGKHILVTGANGYIGAHAVRSLLARGAKVTAADLSSEFIDPRAEIIIGDFLADPELIFRSGKLPDAVIHFAWEDGFNHNAPSHMAKLSAHFRFLTGLADRGVRQIAVMGTMHEVGCHEGMVDENTPCRPLSQYGVAKNALRQALELFCSARGIVFQWLRGFYILGDDERNHSLFTQILKAAKSGAAEFPFTSGNRRYDFQTVDELAEQIAACLMQTEIQGIIHCCSGRPVPLGEVAERFIRDHNLKIRLRYGAFPDRPYDSDAIWGDDSKIRKIKTTEMHL